jgi:outer membrane immunogenic protein
MRWIVSLTACAAALGLLASAHDVSAQQNQQQNWSGGGYNWSGFYGGGNLGGAFGGSDFLSGLGRGVPFFEGQFYPGFADPATPGIIAAYRNNYVDVKSFTGGVQGGYNFWAGGVLLGIEADLNFLNAKKSKTTTATGFNDPVLGAATYKFTNEIDANYIASLRPRIGIPFGGMLLYATGGVALTTLKYDHHFVGSGGGYANNVIGPFSITENASESATKVGWTLGGGVELPLGPNVSVRTEYLFTKFGNISSDDNKISPLLPNSTLDFPCHTPNANIGTPGGTPSFYPPPNPTPRQCFDHKADLLLHSLRLGLNFKF